MVVLTFLQIFSNMISMRFLLVLFLVLIIHDVSVNSACNDSSTVLKLLNGASKMWHCVTDKHRNLTPDENNVFFRLYTRRNKNQWEVLPLTASEVNQTFGTNSTTIDGKDIPKTIDKDAIVQSKYFDFQSETKVLIHGFSETMLNTKMMDIKDAYLSRGEYNVIIVDWGLIANSTCYIHAASSVPRVGELTGRFLNRLFLSGPLHGPVHVIGFSLGAHVAGFVGKTARQGVVKRITGLDPALPMFITKDSADRLHRTDATYVDVIHTCAGILGIKSRIGHADFYPNGGFQQAGCCDVMCSHGRAPVYYYESVIRPDGFKALQCESWKHFLRGECNATFYALMGDASQTPVNGSFYLRTSNVSPYCLSMEGLDPLSSETSGEKSSSRNYRAIGA